MLLHDSFFVSIQRYLNDTYASPITIIHSPLFHSSLTLVISVFGTCSNLVCMLYLCYVVSRKRPVDSNENETKPNKTLHILSNKKYKFLIILTFNDFLLCLSSLTSCLDEKYFFQSLIARLHLCSLHILIWKFTLHFIPLLVIFILIRYHYTLNKLFPSEVRYTSTLKQILFTDLCTLIPFVIAFSWSVDGLWLWGETDIRNFIEPSDIESNQTKDTVITPSLNKTLQNSYAKSAEYYLNTDYLLQQQTICYLQTNDDINFTARLLFLIQADFILLFVLNLIGLALEISLHIRLSCCLITKKISLSIIREQQMSLYMLYILLCLTLTSIPFYLYRTSEIIFDSSLISFSNDFVNSCTLAQIILFGISFKPILFLILFLPSKFLFKCKCYATVKFDHVDNLNSTLKTNDRKKVEKTPQVTTHQSSYSLAISSLYPKIYARIRSRSDIVLATHGTIHSQTRCESDGVYV